MHFTNFRPASNTLVPVPVHFTLSSRWYLNIDQRSTPTLKHYDQHCIAICTKKPISLRIPWLTHKHEEINLKPDLQPNHGRPDKRQNISIFSPSLVFYS